MHCFLILMPLFENLFLRLLWTLKACHNYAPLRRREGILLCKCRSVGRVCPSVPFSFPINNSRMPWPTFLKLCPHIRPGQQMNPIDFGVKGQGHWGQMCQNRFQPITWERHDLPSSNLVHTSVQGSRGTLLFLGSKVKVTGVQTCQNCFRLFK